MDSHILVECVDSVRICAGSQSGKQVGGQNHNIYSIIHFFCLSDFSFQFEIKNKSNLEMVIFLWSRNS